ncbi:MAG TPA: hypothetical protein VHA57_10900 [Actinomycetota bacterium]|nr:hypothetical protein [Actinomycetota bacterium]
MTGAVGSAAHVDDQLQLRARLVDLCFNRAFDADPAGVWHAPSPLLLLGGRPHGPSLSLATHWRAMVAARAREDRELHIHLLGSGDETAALSLDDEEADGAAPRETVAIARVVRALARRTQHPCGIDLLRATDVPTGVGLGVDAAVRAATARAVSGLWGAQSGSGFVTSELAAALDEACGELADHQLCLATPEGFAALARPGPPGAGRGVPGVRVDPARHGFRLMLVTLRVAPGSPPPPRWDPPEAEDELATEGFQLLTGPAAVPAGGHPGHPGHPEQPEQPEQPGYAGYAGYAAGELPVRLGALLDAAQAASLARRRPVVTDRIVTAAREAGAFGARALSSRAVLAVVATPELGVVREAVLAACSASHETSLGARFLTTAGLTGAGQGAGGPLTVANEGSAG